jgi:Contractile injection system tube protein
LQMEFSGADGRDAGLELFFDASEIKDGSVQSVIDTLTELATVRDPGSSKDEMKRPHHCVMVFGNIYKKKTFKCVITSVATKFTMFSPTGDPIRATVNLKLKETHMVDMKKETEKEKAFTGGGQKGEHDKQLQAWIDAAMDRQTVKKDAETLKAEQRFTAGPKGFRPRDQ